MPGSYLGPAGQKQGPRAGSEPASLKCRPCLRLITGCTTNQQAVAAPA